jgi:hypothetical protein
MCPLKRARAIFRSTGRVNRKLTRHPRKLSYFAQQLRSAIYSTSLERFNFEGSRWCCRGGLNSRPLPYQGSALPLSYGSKTIGTGARRAGCDGGPEPATMTGAVQGLVLRQMTHALWITGSPAVAADGYPRGCFQPGEAAIGARPGQKRAGQKRPGRK